MGSDEDTHNSKGKISSRRRSWALVAFALFLATAMAVTTSSLYSLTPPNPAKTEISGGSPETKRPKESNTDRRKDTAKGPESLSLSPVAAAPSRVLPAQNESTARDAVPLEAADVAVADLLQEPPTLDVSHPALVSRKLIIPASWRRKAKSQHSVTLLETSQGHILAAWFGGTWEGRQDAAIYTACYSAESLEWSGHRMVAKPAPLSGSAMRGKRVPLWNPVLCSIPETGETLLFYKRGMSFTNWWGLLQRSRDGGATWGAPEVLGKGRRPRDHIVGPAKNKCLLLQDGTLLAGTSTETKYPNSKTFDKAVKWTVYLEWSRDGARTWATGPSIQFPGNIIQPSLFLDKNGHVCLVARERGTRSSDHTELLGHVVIAKSNSSDGLSGWGPARTTELPCPNSGIDAVRLRDGRLLLIYNHSQKRIGGRAIINVALSDDDGESWRTAMTLEDERGVNKEFSYPAVIQTADGLVHIAYTYSARPVRSGTSGRENLRHVVINPHRI